MPKFKFEMPSTKSAQTTFAKIKTLLSGENDFKKFDQNVSANFDETNFKCLITGSQFKASIQVLPDKTDSSLSQVSVEIDLPLALSLFKGKIQESLEKNLKKILA